MSKNLHQSKPEHASDATKIHIIEESISVPKPILLSKHDVLKLPENHHTEQCSLVIYLFTDHN